MFSYVGVLPYCWTNDELKFLLGREGYVKNWDDSYKWGHFAGKSENTDESFLKGACREAYEESMGLLGTIDSLVIELESAPTIETYNGLTFLLEIEYQPNLPELFDRFYDYALNGKWDKGYLEKDMIDWFDRDFRTNLRKGFGEVLDLANEML